MPYRNGGSDPSGFDCSGFVQWVFAQHGVPLPREVREQFRGGQKIDPRDVQPGDLVFFETVSRGASHVGVAIGGDQFVHAPSSRGVVRVERFTRDLLGDAVRGGAAAYDIDDAESTQATAEASATQAAQNLPLRTSAARCWAGTRGPTSRLR